MNKKIIIELLISNYCYRSDLLKLDYNKWLDLKNVKVGDTVFETSGLFLMVRAYADENYDLAYEYMNRSCGTLLEISNADGDLVYTIEQMDGKKIKWSNADFTKLQKLTN